MDLNIFNLRKIRRITDRYRNFQTFLGDVLDGERSLLTSVEAPSSEHFEVLDSIEDLLNSGIDFDVLSVCSPNGLHAEHTLMALNNKKHVVIEKPMALTTPIPVTNIFIPIEFNN